MHKLVGIGMARAESPAPSPQIQQHEKHSQTLPLLLSEKIFAEIKMNLLFHSLVFTSHLERVIHTPLQKRLHNESWWEPGQEADSSKHTSEPLTAMAPTPSPAPPAPAHPLPGPRAVPEQGWRCWSHSPRVPSTSDTGGTELTFSLTVSCCSTGNGVSWRRS